MLWILTYHRIGDPWRRSPLHPGLISATPEEFLRQVEYVARRFHVVSLQQVLDAVNRRKALPEPAVLITFDDAYRDFASLAWPVLRRQGLPVALFVPTAFPDQPKRCFWWDQLHHALRFTARQHVHTPLGTLGLQGEPDRLRGLRKVQSYFKSLAPPEADSFLKDLLAQLEVEPLEDNGVLGWEELGKLAREGVDLGTHGRTHLPLRGLGEEELRNEICGSRRDLEQHLGWKPLPVFCYPGGVYDSSTLALLEKEGFQLAFTTRDGYNPLPARHPLLLSRTNITARTRGVVFKLRLHPLGSWLDRWRHRSAEGSHSEGLSHKTILLGPRA